MARFLILLAMLFSLITAGCVSQERSMEISASETTTTLAVATASSTIPVTTTEEPYFAMRFLESSSICPMDGNVTMNGVAIGSSASGVLRMQLSKLPVYDNGQNEICIRASLNCAEWNGWKTVRCWTFSLSRHKISQESDFKATINIHEPANGGEMTNFVSPQMVSSFISHQRDIGFFSNDTYGDVEKLWSYARSHFSYRYDSDTAGLDYWKLPNETLVQEWGDCEDFSNLFVSLARAYNSSLECYSILLPDHLGTFCKIPMWNSDSYGFYDNLAVPVRTFSASGESASSKINQAIASYFYEYGLDENNHIILTAFNDKGYFNFKSNDEFVEWAIGL